ncbi:MAG: 6-phosphogluconolactonase, partial [Acidobacteriota bacterium]
AGEHAADMPWEATHIFWGDERCVPPDSEDSNFRMAREALLDAVPIPESNIHRIPAEMSPPQKAAEVYEARLAEHFRATAREGKPPAFDLLMLGIGGEGHTASLFPGSPALEEARRWAVPVTAPEGIVPAKRITLTLPVINAARRVFFLAAGAAKRPVLQDIRNDPEKAARLYPAACVSPRDPVLWFLDREAAD